MLLSNPSVAYDANQVPFVFAEMTVDSTYKIYTTTNKPWSRKAGYEPVVAVYGLATGGAVTPAASLANNQVDVAALTAYMPAATGASATTGLVSVSAATNVAITRGATNGYRINSITINSSGAIAAVAGTESTAFSETRGAAGGPPFIPVGSVEVGQVRTTSTVAAPITAGEIYQVPGVHQELYSLPAINTIDYLRGKVTFTDAQPLIHTGGVPRKVYVRGYTPQFGELGGCRDWVPADQSNSTTSEQFYDGARGGFSSSLGAASFTQAGDDGHTETLLARVGDQVIIRFKSDKNRAPYQLTQGILGVTRSYPYGKDPQYTWTITPQQASVDVAS
jgi:hypothetical protein